MPDADRAAPVPLVGHADPDAPVAWRNGAPIAAAQFLGHAAALAARLPAGGHVFNLCEDRYRFAVTFAAALLAGRTNLFPANRHDDTLRRVAADCPDAIAVAEEPVAALGTRVVLYPPLETERIAPLAAVPRIPADHVAAIVFTSGSTGAPQPNLKRWGRLVASARMAADALGLAHAPGFAVVGTVPPQHMYGFESTVLLPLLAGGTLHPGRPLFPADVHAAVASLPPPRVLVTTPIHIRACVEAALDWPPLARIVSAAAPLDAALAAAAERQFGAPVHEIYGFTEAGQVATRRTTSDAAWRAMGDLRLVGDGAGWAVEGSAVEGRVAVADRVRPLDGSGGAAFLLEGRAADLVNVAGKRASLADLNRLLAAIPGVADGVFHVPAHAGERVERLMAFVVAPGVARQSVVTALRRSIDAAFLPRPLVFLDRLPREATGKLTLETLRRLEAEARGANASGASPADIVLHDDERGAP